MEWLVKKYPKFALFKEHNNEKYFLDQKSQRDKEWKWKNGRHIPEHESLWGNNGMLTSFYAENEVNDEDRAVINESVFFATILQRFQKKTSSFAAFENLKKMSRNEYKFLPDYALLKQNLQYSEAEVMQKVEKYLLACDELRTRLVNSRNRFVVDKDQTHDLILFAEREIERLQGYNLDWWNISRFHGMWYVVFGRNYDKAIPYYMEAVKGVVYSGDNVRTRKIIREALVVCCTAYSDGIRKIEGKNIISFLKRLKQQAIVLGHYLKFEDPGKEFTEVEIELWINFSHNYFHNIVN